MSHLRQSVLTLLAATAAVLTGAASAVAAPPTPSAEGVELGVQLSWAPAPAGVTVERRVEGVGDWSTVSGVVRRATWIDDTVRQDVEYEYRLEDPVTHERSGVVTGAPLSVADTGSAVARVSRVQSTTLTWPCLYDYRLCGGEDPRRGRDVLTSAGGPPARVRDRGAVVTSPAGTFRLDDVTTRACDGGGVTGSAWQPARVLGDNAVTKEFTVPMEADATGSLEQAGADLRTKFGGPLTLLWKGRMQANGGEWAPDVWFTVHTPDGTKIDSTFTRTTMNGDDETVTTEHFGWQVDVSFQWAVEFGWVPAGSRIVTHGRFSAGYPDSQGKPELSSVDGIVVQAARPGACAPALSPDGHRALVSGNGSIIEVDVDNGQRRVVCSGCGSGSRQPEHPVYDVDGRSVLLAENGDIYRVAPDGSSSIAFQLPDDEDATDPVVLADGSIAVVGERGVWTVAPDGQRRLAVPGAGLVGVDGAGRLLAARGVAGRVVAGEDDWPRQPGAVFFDVERDRQVLTAGSGTQLFAGPGARGTRTRVSSLDVSADEIHLDQGVSSSGGLTGTLATLSGPRGLHTTTEQSTLYPILSSEAAMRPEAPTVDAPAATNAETLPVAVTGASPRGVIGARFVIAGRGTEQAASCGGGCTGTPVRESAAVDVAATPEGTYRVAGAIRETGGGAAFATATTKIDRTPPASELPPTVSPDGGRLGWAGVADPTLPDGSAGSGDVRFSARRLTSGGAPSGDWQPPTADISTLQAGPGGAEVRAHDAAGNASAPVKAVRAELPEFDTAACKPHDRDPDRAWLGLSPRDPRRDVDPATADGKSFARVYACFDNILTTGTPWIRHQVPIDAMRDPNEQAKLDAFLTLLNTHGTSGVLTIRGHGWPKCDGSTKERTIRIVKASDLVTDPKTKAVRALAECELPNSALYVSLLKDLKAHVDATAPGRVQRWSPWNEPDHKSFQVGWTTKGKWSPTLGVERAAKYHLDALEVIKSSQLLTAELAGLGSAGDAADLAAKYKKELKGTSLKRWGFHSYKDIVDPGQAKKGGHVVELADEVKPSELFVTESGAMLSADNKPRTLSNKAGLQFEAGEVFRKAEWGKKAVGTFKGLRSQTKLTLFYYQTAGRTPEEMVGDGFDSGIADMNGVARPVLCGIALLKDWTTCAGEPVPSSLRPR